MDLADLARRCPVQLTGADMYALCADAWMNGLKRLVVVRYRTVLGLKKGVGSRIGQDCHVEGSERVGSGSELLGAIVGVEGRW